MKRIILLLVAVSATLPVMMGQQVKYSPEVESRINNVENNLASWVNTGSDDRWNILDRMKKYNINGVSIAVIHDYKVEWAKGYGMADKGENRQVTEHTLFQAASISKSLNSIGVLKLAAKGLINCDSDINLYLKSWKFPYDAKSNSRKITVKELLSHSAGLTIHGFPGYEKGKKLPTLIQVLNGEKPANTNAIVSFEEPGKSVTYSGGGVEITQLLVTDLTGMRYEDYMQKEVLDPLGMTSSCYCQPPDGIKGELLATGYKGDGKEVTGKYHIYPEKAAAGLWTNPADLSRYVIETELSYKGESDKVLSPEMTKFRMTPVMSVAALGSFVFVKVPGSYRYFNHSGGNEGFLSIAWGCLDSGEGVVVMINSENWKIIDEIVNSVAIVYGWKDYYLPEEKKPVALSDNLMKSYLGKYEGFATRLEVVQQGSGLALKMGGSMWNLYFANDSDCFAKESAGMARFSVSPEGKVKGILSNGALLKKKE
jgi:CubicO group peptidase (beta-lactamase class C family)